MPVTKELQEARQMTGGDLLVSALHRWDVDTLFGLPGVQLDAFFDGLYRNPGNIRLVHTRHEQGAAYMAFGYAMATGKVGVCAVVPGPGVLNAGAALATAYACNARVLLITSTVRTSLIGRRCGALHEIEDQDGIIRGLTKWCGTATHASEIPGILDEAFRQLCTGRPRPVAVQIPPDVLGQLVGKLPENERPDCINAPADPALIEKAADLCLEAVNPVIVVGGGAQSASSQVLRLSRLLQAPVVSRYMGRGVLPDTDDYTLPAAAQMPMWPEVDLVIGIGTRLQILREWGHDRQLKVIRVDVDQQEMSRIVPPEVAIRADAAQGTNALNEALAQKGCERPSRASEYRAVKNEFYSAVSEDIQPQAAYLEAIRSAMEPDDVFVDEMTQVGYASRFAFPVLSPRTYICSSYQGTLGYGFATALGAQVGAGRRQVISINGDGGFLYTMPELASAVLHKIPLIAIVFADGNFGNVRFLQSQHYGGRSIATELHNPDFVALAESFGVIGMRATSPAELGAAIKEARGLEGPVLIEVPYDLEASSNPWKFIHPKLMR